MELSHSLVSAISKPTFLFSQVQRPRGSIPDSATPLPLWDSSSLNPKNRIDSLDVTHLRWRIDGATMCGRQFYAVPTCLLPELIPLRIDVLAPDQEQHPPDLRESLQSSFSVCMRHPRLGNLGISRHLCRALDHYCERNPSFLQEYQGLPFGSKLVFENVAANVKAMTLTVVPAHDLERQLLSVSSLQNLWGETVPGHSWPQVVDLGRLRLKRQLHDSISVVSIKIGNSCVSNENFVFKSSTNDPRFVYHELKLLLTNPHHVNLMGPPLYIVTKRCNFGGKHGVCGFILPYYPLGSIRDVLPVETASGTLTFMQRLNWSRQIVSALIHIREVTGTFYSDLRPDNVLLSKIETHGRDDVILCDLEQRGNWHEWCAPEILYRMYAENLRAHPSSAARGYLPQELIAKHLQNNIFSNHTETQIFKTGPHGGNPAWFSLSSSAQEKAQVYSLGLLLYCIFEGVSNPRVSLANAWPCDPDVEFPEFRRTPDIIRHCIRQCTVDAPEWESEDERSPMKPSVHSGLGRVTRVDGRLYPARRGDTDRDASHIADAVLATAKAWWENELRRTKRFFENEDWRTGHMGKERLTLREVLAMLDRVEAEETSD